MSECRKYKVSGKVQGVWFRASTQEKAESLGLTGWVRNLPSGEVEVLACGDNSQQEALLAWLQQGPELAVVKEVTHEILDWQEHDRFAVK
jgi:acylphosphatase